MMSLAERVKKTRLEKELTQSELASMLGMSYHNIQNLEKGRIQTCRYIDRLATALDTTRNYLLVGEKAKVIKVDKPINLISVDNSFEFKPDCDYHIVETPQNKTLFLTSDSKEVASVSQMFIQKIR